MATEASAAGRQDQPWALPLKAAAVVLGTAAWVQLVGTLVMYLRFWDADVPASQSVATLPTDLKFAIGARTIALPLLLGALAVLALVVSRQPGDPEPGRGELPRGSDAVLATLAAAVAVFALARPMTLWGTIAAAAAGAAACLACRRLMRYAAGFAGACGTLFVVTAGFSSLLVTALPLVEPARLDIGVAVKGDGTAIGGYFIARTGDHVYLISLTQPGDRANNQVSGTGSLDRAPAIAAGTCSIAQIAEANRSCSVRQVVGIPAKDVVKVAFGPRAVKVDAAGFQAARTLARVALLREDEEVAVGKAAPSPAASTAAGG